MSSSLTDGTFDHYRDMNRHDIKKGGGMSGMCMSKIISAPSLALHIKFVLAHEAQIAIALVLEHQHIGRPKVGLREQCFLFLFCCYLCCLHVGLLGWMDRIETGSVAHATNLRTSKREHPADSPVLVVPQDVSSKHGFCFISR